MKTLITVLSFLVLLVSCGDDKNDSGDTSDTYGYYGYTDPKDGNVLQVRYMDLHSGADRSTTDIVEGMKYSLYVVGEKCSSIKAYQKTSDGAYYQLINQQTDTNYPCRSYPFVFNLSENTVTISAQVDGKRLTRELNIRVKNVNKQEILKYY